MVEDRPNIFTLEFWQHTITNSVYAFASGALGPLVANQANLIHSVPWYASVSSGAIGMVIVFLTSLASNQIPNRVPGSFIKETDEEERIEKMILREERLALERQRIREREQMDDRHRSPEPERDRPTDDFVITGIPPERQRPNKPIENTIERTMPRRPPPPQPPQVDTPQQRWPPRQPPPQRVSETELPYAPTDYRTPNPQPPPQPPKPVPPQPNPEDMEQWPQGGRRGKKGE